MADLRDPDIQKVLDAYRSSDPGSATFILYDLQVRTSEKSMLMERVAQYPGILQHSVELLRSENAANAMYADAFLRTLMRDGQASRIANFPCMLQEIWAARQRVPTDDKQDFRKRELLALFNALADVVPDLMIQIKPQVISQSSNVVRLYHKVANDVTHADIHQLYPAFKEACINLGFDENHKNLFMTAVRAYHLASRGFHNHRHAYKMAYWINDDIQDLCADAKLSAQEARSVLGSLTIAGLHHDDAYIQVDDGLDPEVERSISKYGHLDKGPQGKGPYSYTINAHMPETGAGKLVCDIFGFKPGQTVYPMPDPATGKQGGLNEFLSALTAADGLLNGQSLTIEKRKSIASVAAMIEATIPFRTAASLEHLYERLLNVGLNPREAEISVKGAVLLANRDVDGFCGGPVDVAMTAEQRLKYFIGGTWQLMPENNRNLRGHNYLPGEYLVTLERNRGFLTSLNPTVIFHHFRGFPGPSEMQQRYALTEQNLDLLNKYLTSKIASASIVTAIANQVDPEGKTSLYDFMNGITCETFFPVPANDHLTGNDLVVFNTLLNRGDSPPYEWDIPGSPIAGFLVQSLGLHESHNIAAVAADYFKGDKPRYEDFLAYFKDTYPNIARHIYSALEQVASTTVEKAAHIERSALMRQAGLKQLAS